MNITEFRKQYPQYNDLSDKQLADSLYEKSYKDMDREEFNKAFGYSEPGENRARQFNKEYGLPSFFGVPEEYGGLSHAIEQGSALAFGDELTGAGSATAAKVKSLFGGRPVDWGKAYNQAVTARRAQARDYTRENPKTALAAELAGGVMTGGGGAGRALGSNIVKEAAKRAPRLTRAVTVAGSGAAGGGAYGYGAGEGAEDSANRAKTGAVIGAVAGPVLQTVGGGIANALASRQMKKIADAAASALDAVTKKGSLYQKAKEAGVVVSSGSMERLSEKLSKTSKEFGFLPKLLPKVSAALDEFAAHKGKDLTLQELDNLRKVMRVAGGSNERAERNLASKLINEIDDHIDKLSQADLIQGSKKGGAILKEARELWTRKRKGELIEDAINKARYQASGFENGLRTQIRSILNSDKKRRGFSQEEIAAMERVVLGTTKENIAKLIGRMAPNEGQATSYIGMMLGISLGTLLGGPIGAVAAPIIGMAGRKAAQKMTRGNVNDLKRLILGGSKEKLAKELAGTRSGRMIESQRRRRANTADELAAALAMQPGGM